MSWVREGAYLARKHKAIAAVCFLAVMSLLAVGVLAIRVAILVADLRQERQDRIQLACNMSFANGQALLDTAARENEVTPETIEAYRQNLQHYANIEIKKYDAEFECKIPEVEEEG